MGNLRHLTFAASTALAIAAASPAAHATVLTPGPGTFSPDMLTLGAGSTLETEIVGGALDSVLPNDFTGTYSEWVYSDTTNPLGPGDLAFVIQVTNDTTSVNAIERVTTGSFTGFATDVGYLTTSPAGSVPPTTVDRLFPDVVGFGFAASGVITPGGMSADLVIETNAKKWTTGAISGINEGTATVSGFAPSAIPEPSTWAMMLLGIAGLGYAGFRSRKTSIGIV